jgi:hypothetical protein
LPTLRISWRILFLLLLVLILHTLPEISNLVML